MHAASPIMRSSSSSVSSASLPRKTVVAVTASVAVAVATIGAIVYSRKRKASHSSDDAAAASLSGQSAPAGSAPGGVSGPQPKKEAAPPAAEVRTEPPLSGEDREKGLRLLNALKQLANTAFQQGRYEEAMKGYENCLSVSNVLGSQDSEVVAIDQVIRANVVMTLIKLHLFEDARMVATMMLQDKTYPLSTELKVKVIYRRGLASVALNDTAAARADFEAAVYLSPNQSNPAAAKELAALSRR